MTSSPPKNTLKITFEKSLAISVLFSDKKRRIKIKGTTVSLPIKPI